MRILATILLFAPTVSAQIDNEQFANELEQCIRGAAQKAVDNWPMWGDGCLAATTKVDRQAHTLGLSITPFEKKYGYQAAL
eukprot:5503901-Prymnesium_polylepis.1